VCFLLGNSPASEFYIFHLHRQVPAYEDGTECSETSAYKIQTPLNCPEESTQSPEHGEVLKSRNQLKLCSVKCVILTALRYINQIPIECDRYCHLLTRTALSLTAWLVLSYQRSKLVKKMCSSSPKN